MKIVKGIVSAVFSAAVLSAVPRAAADETETIGALLRRHEKIVAEMTSASASGNFRYSNQLINEGMAVLERLMALKIRHMVNDLDDSDTADVLTLRKLKRKLAEATTAVALARVYSQVQLLQTQTLRATCFSRNPFDNNAQLQLRAIENYSKLVLQRADELPPGERNAFLIATVGALAAQSAMAQPSAQPAGASAANPRTNGQKRYCARHNCHYELTQGCHFCSAPNYGDTNPWRVRGNWKGEIK